VPDARVSWQGQEFDLPADADVPIRLVLRDGAARAGVELRSWRIVEGAATLLGGLDARIAAAKP
jgi:hypothetical protein